MINAHEKHEEWLVSSKVTSSDKNLLAKMTKQEIEDAFFTDIAFATAGMRGILGPGTNRINYFTIQRATVGFALYLLEKFPDAKKRGVAISHDNRHYSREFTLLAAKVLNHFGIKAYIFDSLRPTPELSYAVRYSHCVGGIMITASHNPKQYNGFKVYDEDGAQLVPDKIARLVEIIEDLPDYLQIELPEPYVENTVIYDKAIDEAYLQDVKKIQINPALSKDQLQIVFSPEHGTGAYLGQRLLNELGYRFSVVEEQMTPDPNFSNTKTPNPEEDGAYEKAIEQEKKKNAQLILVTDPDADRVGVAFRGRDEQYHRLTGNQSGAMLIYYILSERNKNGSLSPNSRLYTTIVTSPLGSKIAAKFGVKSELFLTGFKFIGHAISEAERNGGPSFAFGYEESYGCLISPIVRDKDALQALVMYAEMANFYLQKGLLLDEVYRQIQEEFGYHDDTIDSVTFPGLEGLKAMNAMLARLREKPLTNIDGIKIIKTTDYLTGIEKSAAEEKLVSLPQSDVISYLLETGDRVIIRPSGTEPKCKFYYSICRKSLLEATTAKEQIKRAFEKLTK